MKFFCNVPLVPVTVTVAVPEGDRSGTVTDPEKVPFELTTAVVVAVCEPSLNVMVSVWPAVKWLPVTLMFVRAGPQEGEIAIEGSGVGLGIGEAVGLGLGLRLGVGLGEVPPADGVAVGVEPGFGLFPGVGFPVGVTIGDAVGPVEGVGLGGSVPGAST